MAKTRIYLKSGQVVDCDLEKIEVEESRTSITIRWTGMTTGIKLLYLQASEVAAVTVDQEVTPHE